MESRAGSIGGVEVGEEGAGGTARVRDDPSVPRHQHASPFLGICIFTAGEDGRECVCIGSNFSANVMLRRLCASFFPPTRC